MTTWSKRIFTHWVNYQLMKFAHTQCLPRVLQKICALTLFCEILPIIAHFNYNLCNLRICTSLCIFDWFCAFCTNCVCRRVYAYFWWGDIIKKIGKHFEPYLYDFSLFWPMTWVGGLHYSYDIAHRGYRLDYWMTQKKWSLDLPIASRSPHPWNSNRWESSNRSLLSCASRPRLSPRLVNCMRGKGSAENSKALPQSADGW